MGKKMKLPFLYQSKSLNPKLSSSPTWPFPSCGNTKTLSFRASNAQDDHIFAFSSSSPTHSTTMSEDFGDDPVEDVIRSLQSDRLFFEPDHSSSLMSMPIVEVEKEKDCIFQEKEEKEEENGVCVESLVYKESEILSMDSNNPYEDFRRSMEEMVEAHGLKDWEKLEGLLECYLKINGKKNHGYIVGAFIDLLVNLSLPSSSTTTTTTTTTTITSSSSSCLSTHSIYSSPSSPLSLPSSSLTTPCLYDDAMDDDDDDHNHHCHDVTS